MCRVGLPDWHDCLLGDCLFVKSAARRSRFVDEFGVTLDEVRRRKGFRKLASIVIVRFIRNLLYTTMYTGQLVRWHIPFVLATRT